ncbi:LRRGT00178 [Rattus norvegicus]|uniref:LRRGT00178 n=2 Tax=Rattus norvegicus TaxID=10116 RepID=F7EP06_RAT|nr:LRRGT00178 [Rattus norvegicus]EDL82974.1 LRRGT00178 [Rattus norvegicus]|eukprot:NP_001041408.1 uncharacterized protein LOC499542 [Rattus norvegicus]
MMKKSKTTQEELKSKTQDEEAQEEKKCISEDPNRESRNLYKDFNVGNQPHSYRAAQSRVTNAGTRTVSVDAASGIQMPRSNRREGTSKASLSAMKKRLLFWKSWREGSETSHIDHCSRKCTSGFPMTLWLYDSSLCQLDTQLAGAVSKGSGTLCGVKL